jgi:hypothetical protein
MAHYLVKGELIEDKARELKTKVFSGEFRDLEPFGRAITHSLENAKFDPQSERALWEEEDYCNPPLAQERDAVLDIYFSDLQITGVSKGEGWEKVNDLPSLWEEHPIFRD